MTTFLVRYSGLLASGEHWSTGVHVSGSGSASDVVSAATTAAAALWTDVGGAYPTATTLDLVTVYELDDSTGKAVSRDEATLTHAGTDVGKPMPQEVAVVASLRTSAVGPKGRGRLYLPGPSATALTTSGRLDSTVQGNFATGVAGMLSSLLGAAFTPILFTPGQPNRPIGVIDIGDVFDSQRRRRDKLVESRVAEPVT